MLAQAEDVYNGVGVFGSPDKIVSGCEHFKAIGVEILPDQRARSAGVITAAAPQDKRLPGHDYLVAQDCGAPHHVKGIGITTGRKLDLYLHVPEAI